MRETVMFDTTHAHGDHPIRPWAARRPRIALSAVIALAAVIVWVVLANTHHSGIKMITPGTPDNRVATQDPSAVDRVIAPIQAALARAHDSAATRQAEANG